MKFFPYLCLAAALVASSGIASADTITFNSFGTAGNSAGYTYTPPTVTSTTNTATVLGVPPASTSATYNIPNGGGVWAGPLGASSWVSQNPGNYPGGSNVEPSGTYTYSTEFTISGAVTSGTLDVLADDTTNVVLNGIQIVPAAAGVAGSACTVGTPNCEVTYVVNLASFASDFVQGNNILSFGVNQDFGSAEGLDFSGSLTTVAPTPEPSSLLLLGTGLMAAAGYLHRKMHA